MHRALIVQEKHPEAQLQSAFGSKWIVWLKSCKVAIIQMVNGQPSYLVFPCPVLWRDQTTRPIVSIFTTKKSASPSTMSVPPHPPSWRRFMLLKSTRSKNVSIRTYRKIDQYLLLLLQKSLSILRSPWSSNPASNTSVS